LLEMQALYGEAHGLAAYRQEYECSWEGHQLGSIFGHEIAQMREEGRVLEVEPDLSQPVVRSWDIGMRDDTSVWWAQPQPSGQLLVLDHLAASGMGIEWWRDQVFAREQQRGWIHGNDYVPHDAKVREWGTGRTRVETMVGLGLKPILVPLATVEDGINAVRRTLPVCVFHPRTEDGGLSALEQYRREWDDDNKCFKANPLHDWTSNPADSFRYLAQAWRGAPKREVKTVQPQGWVIPPLVDKPYRGGIRL
jgi:phage terminase large subunit